MLCLLLMACTCTLALAQPKSQQVERYLGNFRYEHDKPAGIVKFIFQKAVLKRQGDGRKTYKTLLISEPFYSNEDNAGRLIGIQIVQNNRTTTIRPEAPDKPAPASNGGKRASSPTAEATTPPAAEPTPDPVRPRGPVKNTGKSLIPDSSTIVANLDNAKQRISGWKSTMWQTVRPIWEFVMWIFNSVIILLICFGGLCRYVAKTAASESLINIYGRIIVGRWIVAAHQNAAAMLLLISWVIAIILLIDVFMWLIYLNLPVWLLVVIWFPILWVAEKLTSWIVPNISVIGPGGEEH